MDDYRLGTLLSERLSYHDDNIHATPFFTTPFAGLILVTISALFFAIPVPYVAVIVMVEFALFYILNWEGWSHAHINPFNKKWYWKYDKNAIKFSDYFEAGRRKDWHSMLTENSKHIKCISAYLETIPANEWDIILINSLRGPAPFYKHCHTQKHLDKDGRRRPYFGRSDKPGMIRSMHAGEDIVIYFKDYSHIVGCKLLS